jgi:LPXTG-site transpeptidase (sortase) family protein
MTDLVSLEPELHEPFQHGGSGVDAPEAVPPLSPKRQVVRAALLMVFAISFGLVLQLTVVSRLQHNAAQGRKFNQFRGELATGIAPIGPLDEQNRELAPGTPVAYLQIPRIGVKEIVSEGTTPAVLFTGAGHRRDTPLPGQTGTSIVFGRRSSYGGPFHRLPELRKGDIVTVTTGQGVFEYHVLGVRTEGMPIPPAPAADSSRLTLITAAGTPYVPNGVLRVDADLKGQATGGPPRAITTASLPPEERANNGDARTLWALALWLQALVALAIAAVWAWLRWGRAQTWIVFLPLLMLAGIAAAGQVARLLPNLL